MGSEQDVVLKIMGTFSFGDADIDEYVEQAKERMFEDENMRIACILQPEDTINIFERGASIKVLEPQWYRSVTTLDRTHFMFSESHDDGGCAGMFYAHEGNAVSGSGCDKWYKISPELLEFCSDLALQIHAFAMTLEKADTEVELLKDSIDEETKKLECLDKKLGRARNALNKINALRAEKKAELQGLKRNLLKRKVECLTACGKLRVTEGCHK